MVNKEGALKIDLNDEVIRETMVTHEGQVVNARIREMLGNSAEGMAKA